MNTTSSSRPFLLSLASAMLLSLSLSACVSDDTGGAPRGSLGKADLVGSCEGSCDGPSATGSCWCDADCAAIGDCCADIALECPVSVTSCGGFLGLACGPDEYCEFSENQSCGAADQLGVCATIPQVCAQIVDPVCGCDQQTYSSACHAAAAGVSVLQAGDCLDICPDIAPPAPGFCSGNDVETAVIDTNGCTIGFECVSCPQIEPPPLDFCNGNEVETAVIDTNGCLVGFECVSCPQIEPPPLDFCNPNETETGVIDTNGCLVGFECVAN